MLMKCSAVEFAVVGHAVGTPPLICDLLQNSREIRLLSFIRKKTNILIAIICFCVI